MRINCKSGRKDERMKEKRRKGREIVVIIIL